MFAHRSLHSCSSSEKPPLWKGTRHFNRGRQNCSRLRRPRRTYRHKLNNSSVSFSKWCSSSRDKTPSSSHSSKTQKQKQRQHLSQMRQAPKSKLKSTLKQKTSLLMKAEEQAESCGLEKSKLMEDLTSCT